MRVNPLARLGAEGQSGGMGDKNKEREERLAAALRENLRRRKAQARELTNAAKDSDDHP